MPLKVTRSFSKISTASNLAAAMASSFSPRAAAQGDRRDRGLHGEPPAELQPVVRAPVPRRRLGKGALHARDVGVRPVKSRKPRPPGARTCRRRPWCGRPWPWRPSGTRFRAACRSRRRRTGAACTTSRRHRQAGMAQHADRRGIDDAGGRGGRRLGRVERLRACAEIGAELAARARGSRS